MESEVKKVAADLADTAAAMSATIYSDVPRIAAKVALEIFQSLQSGGKILLAGNGGSAADAQHIAAEFVNYFNFPRPALRAIALTTDTSVLTSVSNDTDYEQVFARQVQSLGDKGDILWLYSTSGSSKNVVRAAATGKEMGLKVVVFVGDNSSALEEYADFVISIPSSSTPKIQEVHLALGHSISGLVEGMFFKPNS